MITVKTLLEKIQAQILDPLIALLFVLATVIFLWGVIQYVIMGASNPAQAEKGKKVMLWGIIGMFVMVSAWGIVKLLCDFFGTCQ